MLLQTYMPPFLASRTVIIAALCVVLALFTEEGLHLRHWDTKGDRRFLQLPNPRGCTPRPGIPNYMWCDMPGFGRMLYRCTNRQCGYQDPSAPLISLQAMQQEELDMDQTVPVDEDRK